MKGRAIWVLACAAMAAITLAVGCGKKDEISKQTSAAVEASGGKTKLDPASMKAKSPFNPGMTGEEMKGAAASSKGKTPPIGG